MAKKTVLSDEELEAEHQARLSVLDAARVAYDADRSDANGRTLRDARLAVGESQGERNARHGAPPAQTIGS